MNNNIKRINDCIYLYLYNLNSLKTHYMNNVNNVNNVNKDNQITQSNNDQNNRVKVNKEKELIENQENKDKTEKIGEIYENYNVETVAGDGHCLFRSISGAISGSVNEYKLVRYMCYFEIYEHPEKYIEFFEDNVNKEEYLNRLKNDNQWGGNIELSALANLFNCKIEIYTGNIIRKKGKLKLSSSKLINTINSDSISSNKNDFTIRLVFTNVYGKSENKNHYSYMIDINESKEEQNTKKGKWDIQVKKIKDIMEKNENSIQTVPPKEKFENLDKNVKEEPQFMNYYCPISKTMTNKNSRYLKQAYQIGTSNQKLEKSQQVIFENITNSKITEFNEIYTKFSDKSQNLSLAVVLNQYTNIKFTKNLFAKNQDIRTVDLSHDYNISNNILPFIPKGICYQCSGTSKKNKPLFRVYNSMDKLKKHCDDNHNGCINNCIINYALPNNYVEVEAQKGKVYYLMEINHMNDIDIKNYQETRFQNDDISSEKKDDDDDDSICEYTDKILDEIQKDKGKGGYLDISNKYIRIIGCNVRTLNQGNIDLLIHTLEEIYPDIILLNECDIKNKNKKIQNYSFFKTQKCGILIKEELNSMEIMKNANDEFNMIRKLETQNGSLVIYVTYAQPGIGHKKKIENIYNNLIELKKKYGESLKLIMFGDLNMKREKIRNNKYFQEVVKYNFSVIMNDNINEYTRIENVLGEIKTSYIDYFIIHGFKDHIFNITDSPVITDHKGLELLIKNDEIGYIKKTKQVIESYILVKNKYKEIQKKLSECILNGNNIRELYQLFYELNCTYKPIKRKRRDMYNIIKKLPEEIKLSEKNNKEYIPKIRKAIYNLKKENWHSFLNELQNYRCQNHIKEYFKRLSFYTNINKKVDILRNLEIKIDNEPKIIVDKDEINGLILKKYQELLGDHGHKNIYFNIAQDETINVNEKEVKQSIKCHVKDKAVSWDLIPGKSIKGLLLESNAARIITKLTEMINFFLTSKCIPIEIMTSRLFCLNKDGQNNGNIDKIRPIAISSSLYKIIEGILLYHLNKEVKDNKLIHPNQIGFIQGAGCELNIMKLRQNINLVKRINKKHKFLLFIDLKNAYDKVDHSILFRKLENRGINKKIIGTIKLIYSHFKLKISNTCQSINVNNGVLQGSLISPVLFDLYIDDLIRILSEYTYDCLAYADDLAIICQSEEILTRVMNDIQKWSDNNKIRINKSKSGIMMISGIENREEINGYPIVSEYRYLGVLITNKMGIKKHIGIIDNKLDEYFNRNYMLSQRYFSVKSILCLFNYYHSSRLLYGLAEFIDKKESIKKVEKVFIGNIKKLLKLPISTNTNRLRVALGIPKLEIILACRLLKLKEKYKNIFGNECTFYDNKIRRILNLTNDDPIPGKEQIDTIITTNIRMMGNEIGINKIINNFKDYLHMNIYYWYVDSDNLLLRMICNVGQFREDINEICPHCQNENSRNHIVNDCPFLEKERKRFVEKIRKFGINENNPLRIIEKIYFGQINNKDLIKKVKSMITIVKEYIRCIYYKYMLNR